MSLLLLLLFFMLLLHFPNPSLALALHVNVSCEVIVVNIVLAMVSWNILEIIVVVVVVVVQHSTSGFNYLCSSTKQTPSAIQFSTDLPLFIYTIHTSFPFNGVDSFQFVYHTFFMRSANVFPFHVVVLFRFSIFFIHLIYYIIIHSVIFFNSLFHFSFFLCFFNCFSLFDSSLPFNVIFLH